MGLFRGGLGHRVPAGRVVVFVLAEVFNLTVKVVVPVVPVRYTHMFTVSGKLAATTGKLGEYKNR